MVWKLVKKLWPSSKIVARTLPFLGAIVLALGGYVAGRTAVSPTLRAQGVAAQGNVGQTQPKSDYDQRVVAWIHNTIPITREELGEFLIARFGPERLETLVNRRIIELACKTKGIEITNHDVEERFRADLKALGPQMTARDFESQILRRFNKSLIEWKEDVVRPKLMMTHYVWPTIEVTEDDLRKGFEGRYGEKVECRMIVLPNDRHREEFWHQCKKSEADFVRVATTNNLPQLAAVGGKVPPIHKHFGDANLERIAFGLQVGEVSPIIEMPDKTVIILKCDKHLPRDVSKQYDVERLALHKEIFEMKLNQRIPEAVAELRKQANAQVLLRNATRQEELERIVVPEIGGGLNPPVPAPTKQGG